MTSKDLQPPNLLHLREPYGHEDEPDEDRSQGTEHGKAANGR